MQNSETETQEAELTKIDAMDRKEKERICWQFIC
jgi:hypothetical protein